MRAGDGRAAGRPASPQGLPRGPARGGRIPVAPRPEGAPAGARPRPPSRGHHRRRRDRRRDGARARGRAGDRPLRVGAPGRPSRRLHCAASRRSGPGRRDPRPEAAERPRDGGTVPSRRPALPARRGPGPRSLRCLAAPASIGRRRAHASRVRGPSSRHRPSHRPRRAPQALLLPDQERRAPGLRSRGDRGDRQHRPVPQQGPAAEETCFVRRSSPWRAQDGRDPRGNPPPRGWSGPDAPAAGPIGQRQRARGRPERELPHLRRGRARAVGGRQAARSPSEIAAPARQGLASPLPGAADPREPPAGLRRAGSAPDCPGRGRNPLPIAGARDRPGEAQPVAPGTDRLAARFRPSVRSRGSARTPPPRPRAGGGLPARSPCRARAAPGTDPAPWRGACGDRCRRTAGPAP